MNIATKTDNFESYSNFLHILEACPTWSEHLVLAREFRNSFETDAHFKSQCLERKMLCGEPMLQMVASESAPMALDVNAVRFAAAVLKKWDECPGACGNVALVSHEAILERDFPFVPCPWNQATDFNDVMSEWARLNQIDYPIRDVSGNVIHFVYGVETIEEDFPTNLPYYPEQSA